MSLIGHNRHGEELSLHQLSEEVRPLLRFIIGLIIGALGATYFIRSEYARQMDLDTRLDEFQDRANDILAESRRVLDETREQISQVTGMTKPTA